MVNHAKAAPQQALINHIRWARLKRLLDVEKVARINWKIKSHDGSYVLLTLGFHWEWDDHCKSSGAFLSCNNRKVNFYSDYSCGTAAIRGTKELTDGHHYWEVKMTSPVYGTDMVSIVSAAGCSGGSLKNGDRLLSCTSLPFFSLRWWE